MKEYILNQETERIELHFEKADFMALSNELKNELRRHFLFSKSIPAWVSRSTKNHYCAIETAKKLGFTEKKVINDKLSFAEKVVLKSAKAERRAEKYNIYADNAERRAIHLQADLSQYSGDIAFFTQPNINSSSGRAFSRQRDKILNRYGKGFEEYRKSECFKEKAQIALKTASNSQSRNPIYLDNRIKESQANLRRYERLLNKAENDNNASYVDKLLSLIEDETDKLAFYQNCLDEIGGIKWSKDNITKDNILVIRGRKAKVERVNRTTVSVVYIEHPLSGWASKVAYAEIQEVI